LLTIIIDGSSIFTADDIQKKEIKYWVLNIFENNFAIEFIMWSEGIYPGQKRCKSWIALINGFEKPIVYENNELTILH